MKNLFLILFLLIFGMSNAQHLRTEIRGTVKVPAGSDAEGINIFNRNSRQGSVTGQDGKYEIAVKQGDSLYFSALQFQDLLVVVDEAILEEKTLHVEITEGLNELPEVVIREHDLSGNIAADLQNIEVVELNLPSFSAADISMMYPEWQPGPDGQSAISNPAVNSSSGGLKNGANPLAIVGLVVDAIIPKRKPKPGPEPYIGRIELEKIVREKFDDTFFTGTLQIQKQDISSFFDFCEKSGFPRDLLKKEMELDLFEYLMQQSKLFSEA